MALARAQRSMCDTRNPVARRTKDAQTHISTALVSHLTKPFVDEKSPCQFSPRTHEATVKIIVKT